MTHDDRIARRKEMAKVVKNGTSREAVAQNFSVSLATVTSACRENGVNVDRRGEKQLDRFDAYKILADLINTRKKVKVIAKDNGDVSVQRVSQIYRRARKAGIEMPMRKNGTGKIDS